MNSLLTYQTINKIFYKIGFDSFLWTVLHFCVNSAENEAPPLIKNS